MQHLAGFYQGAALTFVFYKLTHCRKSTAKVMVGD
jgi:hypothetical protein